MVALATSAPPSALGVHRASPSAARALNLRGSLAGTRVALLGSMARKAKLGGGLPPRGARRPLEEKLVSELEGGLRALALVQQPHSPCAATSEGGTKASDSSLGL